MLYALFVIVEVLTFIFFGIGFISAVMSSPVSWEMIGYVAFLAAMAFVIIATLFGRARWFLRMSLIFSTIGLTIAAGTISVGAFTLVSRLESPTYAILLPVGILCSGMAACFFGGTFLRLRQIYPNHSQPGFPTLKA